VQGGDEDDQDEDEQQEVLHHHQVLQIRNKKIRLRHLVIINTKITNADWLTE
jgi:hypothetical protein